jgi:nuclear GTP-binding protein
MVGKNKKSAAAPDTRKPKHSNDSARANKKSKNGMRDAATASCWGQQSPGRGLEEGSINAPGGGACAATALPPLPPASLPPPPLIGTHPPALPVFPCLQVRRLEMYNSKAKRDKRGKIISRDFQSKDLPSTRIQPDRRWFGNTRVIGQKQLEAFREEMGAKVADPYAVLIREKKLPLSLLEDPEKKGAGERRGGCMGCGGIGPDGGDS